MPLLFTLKLYTTAPCHLCDDAHQLLRQLSLPNTINLIEIAEDDALLARYGTSIPVLQRADNDQELYWPFTKDQVLSFIKP